MGSIIVTGGAGFLGSRVIARLLAEHDADRLGLTVDRIVSLDLVPCPVGDPRVDSIIGDLADPALVRRSMDSDTIGICHLAAVLSGGSEDDPDLAWQVNVTATRTLLEAARAVAAAPRFVFTSSLAVFGGELPELIVDATATQPESTYGTHKAMGELLVNEYSRRGWVDARICRLPTITVRPGKHNSAASSFASGIIREPLNGESGVCPVPLDTRMWLSSPGTAVANLVHAITLDPNRLGAWRAVNLPGISVTVAEMLTALEAVGGAGAVARVEHVPDQRIAAIVGGWPAAFETFRAVDLGFTADAGFEDIVRQYCAEFFAGPTP